MALSTIQNNSFADTAVHGYRNLVINGGMIVSQRGDFTSASSASINNYYVDRWLAVVVTVTANKQHVLNTTYGNSFLLTATSTGSGRLGITQRLETQTYMLNTTVTLSCWVKSNNANARLYIYNDVDGTSTSSPHTGDGTWQKLTMSLALTSGWTNFEVSSRIMSSANGNVSITSGDYIETAQVQLELGSQATPFENRLYADELQRCQRYFQISQMDNNISYRASSSSAGSPQSCIFICTTMRTTPSATVTASSDGFGGTITGVIPNVNNGFRLFGSSSVSGGTISEADATIQFDAEL
jgi:hypothetical protein